MNRSPEYAQGAVAALREAKAVSIKNAVAVGTLESAAIGLSLIHI